MIYIVIIFQSRHLIKILLNLLKVAHHQILKDQYFYVKNHSIVKPFLSENESIDLQLNYLTQKGLFSHDKTRYSDGYKYEKLISYKDNNLITSINTTVENNLEQNQKLVWVDLSNKPLTTATNIMMNETLKNPDLVQQLHSQNIDYFNRMKEFVAAQEKSIFPAGSKCFKFDSFTDKTPHIDFTLTPSSIIASSSLKEATKLLPNSSNSTLSFENWAGYNVVINNYIDIFSIPRISALIEFNGKIYSAAYTEKGSRADQIADYKALIKTYQNNAAPKSTIDNLNIQIKFRKNECDGYNKTAAQAIDNLLLKFNP